MPPTFYDANLSICCVDGATIYGLISHDAKQLYKFLRRYDHEGSAVSLTLRRDPDTFEEVDGDQVYATLKGLIPGRKRR